MTALSKLFASWNDKQVLVIGDTGIITQDNSVIGAASIAHQLSQLKIPVNVITTSGNDPEGTIIKQFITQHLDLNSGDLITIPYQSSIILNSYGDLQTVNLDETTTIIQDEQKILSDFTTQAQYADVIIVVDYGYMFTPAIRTWIKEYLKKPNRITAVITNNPLWYLDTRPTIMMMTYKQIAQLAHLPHVITSDQKVGQIKRYSTQLLSVTNARALSIMIENSGIGIFSRGKYIYHPFAQSTSIANQHHELTSIVAALSLAFSTDKPLPLVIEPALKAAQQLWTNTYLDPKKSNNTFTPQKIISNRNELIQLLSYVHRINKKIVLTNGCFDLLRPGHIQYLERAKALGDILIVGVNTDENIQQFQGPNHPINMLQDRMHILSELPSVDYVVSYPEKTAVELVKLVKPHIYVKGDDYKLSAIPEAAWVKLYGGEVKIIPYSIDHPTKIIETIKTSPQKKIRSSREIPHYDSES